MKNFLEYLYEITTTTSTLRTRYFEVDDFTIGFELEGCLKYGTHLYWLTYPKLRDALTKDLISGINAPTTYSKPNCKKASVNVVPNLKYNKSQQDKTFEYSSPAIKCSKENLNRIADCLERWNSGSTDYGIYTNETCSFHVHLKFEDMSQKDLIWILCNMAYDKKFYEKYTRFSGTIVSQKTKKLLPKEKSITFENPDNTYTNFTGIRTHMNGIVNRVHNFGKNDIRTRYENKMACGEIYDKMQLLLLHGDRKMSINPKYGTIEWTGPRNFMNHNNNINIRSFINTIYDLATDMAEYLTLDTIPETDVTREEFTDFFFKETENDLFAKHPANMIKDMNVKYATWEDSKVSKS